MRGFANLKACVIREELLLESEFLSMAGFGNLLVDTDSQQIMSMYLKKDKGIPASNPLSDHALFRAVSLAVCAKESLTTELRLRCCIEMVKYESYYRYQKNHQSISRFAPDYRESCIDCCIAEEGASLWTMSALASVARRTIVSVYPCVNGLNDPAYEVFNTQFQPRIKEVNTQFLRILWSSHGVPIIPGKWKPNHFIPLFDAQQAEIPRSPEPEPQMSHFAGSNGCDTMEIGGDCREQYISDPSSLCVAEGGFPLEYNKFMDVYEAYDKITQAEKWLPDIPRGLKEDTWFLVDNSHNISHPEKRNSFFDDCGVWDSRAGSVAKIPFLVKDGTLSHSMKYKQGKFIKTEKVKAEDYEPFDPQPDPDSVVWCHRYYACLKRCPSYRRRILWFVLPVSLDTGKHIAVVEYSGMFPSSGKLSHCGYVHGQKAMHDYVRTDPKLLEEVATMIEKGGNLKPMKLFREMQNKLGNSCTLRDPRQIRNLKYSVKKRMRLGMIPRRVDEFVDAPFCEQYLHTNNDCDATNSHDDCLVATGQSTNTLHPDGSPVQYVIQQTDNTDDITSLSVKNLDELPEGVEFAHGKIVELEDGQQAFTFLGSGDGESDSSTIIMIKDLNAALVCQTDSPMTAAQPV